MRKFSLIFFLCLISPTLVYAESTNSTIRQEIRQEYRQNVQERVVTRIENREEHREEFKSRLQTLKDERKQKLAEFLYQQLNSINDRATQHLQKVLVRLDELLDKIATRNPEADTTVARAKIDEAKTSVTAQSEKDYVINFTDEADLRAGAKAAKEQLHTDLKTVRELVRLARQAVADAWQKVRAL